MLQADTLMRCLVYVQNLTASYVRYYRPITGTYSSYIIVSECLGSVILLADIHFQLLTARYKLVF